MNLEPEPTGTTPDEDFAAAFAKFSKPDDAPADVAPAAVVEDVPADVAPAAVVEDAPADVTPADAAPAADAVPADAPAAVVEDAPVADVAPAAVVPPSADDILSRLDKIVTSAAAPADAAPAAVVEDRPAATPLYTEDEQKFLTDYEKDWSDVSKGEALRRRAENAALVEFVFTEIAKTIMPLKEMTETMAARTHATDLETKIGKYDDSLRDQVVTWIDKQPDYLQSAYKQVIDEGTSDQVADLIVRFRKETGSATPVPQLTGKGGTELSTPAKQAADALAPVETKRTVIEQQDDPNDFKAAFAKFSKVLDG